MSLVLDICTSTTVSMLEAFNRVKDGYLNESYIIRSMDDFMALKAL